MAAIAYRLRCVVRGKWAPTLVVTSIVAIACAAVLTVAAGAHRTATAPDRYTARSGTSFDALVTQENGGRPRTGDVAALSGVESAESFTFVFGGLTEPGSDGYVDAFVFSGSHRPLAVKIVDGRDADPVDEHEFVASRIFVERTGANIGDSFDLVTLTQDQADTDGFSVSDPQGPRLTVELVGIVDGPGRLDDPTAIALVSPALLDRPEIGVALTLIAVDLRPDMDLAALRAALDTLPGSEGLSVEPGLQISNDVRRAVQIQARGLYLLAAAAAIATVAVLGQLITRQVRPKRSERERLSAIGFTSDQILAETVANAMIPITIGSLIGAGLAIIPSGSFPSGFVRIIEPNPGLLADPAVLLGGAVLFIVALALWVLGSLVLTGNSTRSVLPSSLVETVATRIGSATAATGIRLAFTRHTGGRGSVRGAMIGLALTTAGVVGAFTFGASLDRLMDQPFRYGTNYDLAMGDNGAGTLPEGLREELDGDPDVTSLMLYSLSNARVGDTTVPLLGMEVVRGDATPTLLDGRLPAGADEIAFGRTTARRVGAGIGDDVTIAGPTQTEVFRVTGLAVLPGFGANEGMGEGGVLTAAGMARVDEGAQPTSAALQLRIDRAQFVANRSEGTATPSTEPFVPSAIVNVGRIRAVPFALAGVLAALAVLTVGHVMLTSTRSGMRDLTVLRSLGAGRRWIGRAVHWQATSFTALAVAVAIPLGIVVGRLMFLVFADSMGVVDDAAIPVGSILVGVAALVALANVVAAFPARRAGRTGATELLRAE